MGFLVKIRSYEFGFCDDSQAYFLWNWSMVSGNWTVTPAKWLDASVWALLSV